MKLRSYSLPCISLLALSFAAFGCGDKGGSSGDDTAVAVLPVDGGAPCILNADCSDGAYCDLGQCVQQCNGELACDEGLECSPRGKCIAPGETHVDPAPVTKSKGAVSLSPSATMLTEGQTSVALQLHSTSSDPVRYRVEVWGKTLKVGEARGVLEGDAELNLEVQADQLGAGEAAMVKVFTELGEVAATVEEPKANVVTGRYVATLHYADGTMDLGETRFAADVVQQGSKVSLRIDPKESLLFPASTDGAGKEVWAQGFGEVGPDGQVALTIGRLFSGNAASGSHLARDVGSHLALSVDRVEPGLYRGTFDESFRGIFADALEVSGTIELRRVSEEAVEPFEATLPAMPNGWTTPTAGKPNAFFKWAAGQECTKGQFDVPWSGGAGTASVLGPENLQASLKAGDKAYKALAEACATSLANGTTLECGAMAPLQCKFWQLAGGDTAAATVASANELMPALYGLSLPVTVIGRQALANGINESASGSPAAELKAYDAGAEWVNGALRFFMQPQILRNLRDSKKAAAQPWLTGATTGSAYAGAKALVELLQLSAELEQARGQVLEVTLGADEDRVALAQAGSIGTFLDTMAALGLVRAWEVEAGESLQVFVSQFTGVLTPMERGFQSLLAGSTTLGLAEKRIPFRFDPLDTSGATNFEQLLAIAGKAVTTATTTQTSFQNAYTTDASNAQALQEEALAMKEKYADQLLAICGNDFDLNSVTGKADFASCGKKSGSMNSLLKGVESSVAQHASAMRSVTAQRDKIAITDKALRDTLGVKSELMEFMSETGEKINALNTIERQVDLMLECISIASGSSLWNAGAPAALAAGAAMVGQAKNAAADAREKMQLAQTMKIQESELEEAQIEGMANLQKMAIDETLLIADAADILISIADARVKAATMIDDAFRIWENWQEAQRLSASDPARDPFARVTWTQDASTMVADRVSAQIALLKAGRALEHELNTPMPSLEAAVLSARGATKMESVRACLESVYDSAAEAYGSTQPYDNTVSVRAMLGILGERTDECTGEVLSAGEQFRRYVLRNGNLDEEGNLHVHFSTNLMPGNGLWSVDVCNDQISSLQVQLVGDFLGDNEAQVEVVLSGASAMRACDAEETRLWELDLAQPAVVAAGVNSFGTAEANTSLNGQSVARSDWDVVVKSGKTAPANADIDLTKIEDILLKVSHRARPGRSGSGSLDLSCLK